MYCIVDTYGAKILPILVVVFDIIVYKTTFNIDASPPKL